MGKDSQEDSRTFTLKELLEDGGIQIGTNRVMYLHENTCTFFKRSDDPEKYVLDRDYKRIR